MIDPFSDEADPLRLDGSRPPTPDREPATMFSSRAEAPASTFGSRAEAPASTAPAGTLELGRRQVVLALAVLPAIAAVSGCARVAPACPTQPADPYRCRHRFCRHYGS